jgi:antitoxin PrlF
MPTTMTAKAQVTIPKAVRDKAGIQPGDRVEVRVGDGGEIILKRTDKRQIDETFVATVRRIQERRSGTALFTTDEIMAMTRGED